MWSNRSRIRARAVRAFRLARYEQARKELDELIGEIGENPNTLHVLGLCAERSGDPVGALAYVERALAVDDGHFEALRLAIRLAVLDGRDGDARSLVTRALSALPPPPRSIVDRFLGRPGGEHRRDRDLREWIEWAHGFVARSSREGESEDGASSGPGARDEG